MPSTKQMDKAVEVNTIINNVVLMVQAYR